MIDFEELGDALRPTNISEYHQARIKALEGAYEENLEFLKVVRATMKKIYIHMYHNQGKLRETAIDWDNVQLIINKLDDILNNE